MNKLRNIIKESLLCVKSIYERNLTITEKGINTLIDTAEEEILKEFVHKDSLGKVADNCVGDFPKSFTNSQITAFQKGVDKMWSTFFKLIERK